MEKHINVAASLQIGLSILGIVAGLVIFVLLTSIAGIVADKEAQIILPVIGKVIAGIVIVCSLPGIIAGIGLFKRKEWGRILTLIISVLHLVNFPVGTAVGIYCIWAMIQPEVTEQFKIS
jgi:hypothetical protein